MVWFGNMVFKRCRKQPSSTTFIADVDTEALKKALKEIDPVFDEDCRVLHFGDCPSWLEAEVFFKAILPKWKEVVKDATPPYNAVVDAGGAKSGWKSSVGMLVVTVDRSCPVGCPWCYARGWNSEPYEPEELFRFVNKNEDKIREELRRAIHRCLNEVRDLSVVVGGNIDPMLPQMDHLLYVVRETVQEVRKELENPDKWVYFGVSTSNWFDQRGNELLFTELRHADVVALTVLHGDLRLKHPKLKHVDDDIYQMVLSDVVSELLPHADVMLTFIYPYVEALELDIPLKYARDLELLLLHPHNWFDKLVYKTFDDDWCDVVDVLLRNLIQPWNPIKQICFDACLVKRFTGIDLCTGHHWRLHLPSFEFEEVKPCPRGGRCYF